MFVKQGEIPDSAVLYVVLPASIARSTGHGERQIVRLRGLFVHSGFQLLSFYKQSQILKESPF